MYVGEIQIDIGNTIREDNVPRIGEIYMLLEQGASIMEKMRYKYIRVGRGEWNRTRPLCHRKQRI